MRKVSPLPRDAKMFEHANNVCVKCFLARVFFLQIVRYFVAKVSYVAILRFFVAFFLAHFGTLCYLLTFITI